ncbi:beta-N-acetylhexosaminidase [Cohnella fermenti]|uniref:Glycoside hydrolase family 20 catalytic domain-containing protein n=1 Tax=Cohnella fermenti TaxID=2565925 RepID=A0A4S4BTC4_9BACL|nr:glycoside hydrolase family 20 protein [Cohnella fermenti]THF77755.1 hypothetical protein E6C55_15555 [Cohnella fermenti]
MGNEAREVQYAVSSVQSYQLKGEAIWEWQSNSRLIVISNDRSSNNERLDQTLELLQSEMLEMKLIDEGSMAITHGSLLSAEAGDIVIEMRASEEGEDSEKYTIEVGDVVTIQASGTRGLLYGARWLLLRTCQQQPIPHGVIVDSPVIKERALHIDIGRKYFTCHWIKERIKEMSYLRLNTLQLHFSENEGFAFASERHPEIVSERHLSMKEILEIKEEAKKYDIAIIPSLDSPGHLAYALRAHEEWLLRDREGNAAKGALDISNPEARAFIVDLIGEYANLFEDSTSFHIGGDEFIDFDTFESYPQLAAYARQELGIADGDGIDTYIDYLNEIAELLESRGFVVRAWNDGLYRANQVQRVHLKPSIQIAYWTRWHVNMATVQTILDKGHDVLNYNDGYFYYVLGENAGYKYPSAESIYEQWHPGLFSRPGDALKQELDCPYPRQLKGCSFAIWSDTPSAQTEAEVSLGIREPLLAMAELSWIGEKRYEQFRDAKAGSEYGSALL